MKEVPAHIIIEESTVVGIIVQPSSDNATFSILSIYY